MSDNEPNAIEKRIKLFRDIVEWAKRRGDGLTELGYATDDDLIELLEAYAAARVAETLELLAQQFELEEERYRDLEEANKQVYRTGKAKEFRQIKRAYDHAAYLAREQMQGETRAAFVVEVPAAAETVSVSSRAADLPPADSPRDAPLLERDSCTDA